VTLTQNSNNFIFDFGLRNCIARCSCWVSGFLLIYLFFLGQENRSSWKCRHFATARARFKLAYTVFSNCDALLRTGEWSTETSKCHSHVPLEMDISKIRYGFCKLRPWQVEIDLKLTCSHKLKEIAMENEKRFMAKPKEGMILFLNKLLSKQKVNFSLL